jgi:ADP-heptose:LPS heptosyltransferase
VEPRDHDGVAPDANARRRGESWCRAQGIARDATLLGVVPNGGSPLKTFPPERMAEAVAAACDAAGAKWSDVLIFACPHTDAADRVAEALARRGQPARRRRLVPVLPLHVTAALLQRCDRVVSNDTGLMHLAAAVGTPVTGVFGPTDPALYQPRNHPAHRGVEPPYPWAQCPLRRREAMGAPPCVVDEQCQMKMRSCVDRIDPAKVAVTLTVESTPAPATP